MPEWIEIETVPPPPKRPDDGHKGTFGTVVVVGGSATMIGAPAICARAAFRAGAGLVKLAAPPAVLTHAIVIEPGATGIALQGEVREQVAAIEEADSDGEAVLAVGPGLGQAPQAGDLVMALLGGRRAVVLDADGLNLLAKSKRKLSGTPAVLTPHPGEFKRLAAGLGITQNPVDENQRPAAAIALARAHQAVVVLKGRRTVVTDGKKLYVNTTGNPALATAGTGDVLTGIIASLIAQGMNRFDAAVLGVRAHGRAADQWSAAHGRRGLLARHLADLVPAALMGC